MSPAPRADADQEPITRTSTPSPAWARLLTHTEYQRTVEDLLGTELNLIQDFPPEPTVNGFSNNAQSHQLNPLLLEQHHKAAKLLAQEAKAQGFTALGTCSVAIANDSLACARELITHFGLRAYRRPLRQEELDSLLSLYQKSAEGLSHGDGLSAVLEAMLLAPQFLYRVEAPQAEIASDAIQLGPYEVASRLSYFFTGTMPDSELLQAANSGSLFDQAAIESQARRLLDAPRTAERVREFHAQWLGLNRLASIARDGTSAGIEQSLLTSLHSFMDHIFWSESSSVSDLYSSDLLIVNAELSALYGTETPGQVDWLSVAQPEVRFGLLTQPALLTLLAHSDQSAPVKRGVFVRETILCQEVKPPPPRVNNNPPDPDPTLTTRERFAIHTADAACAKCHSVIDPIGFGFEAYDHLGRHRSVENGKAIDTTGEILDLAEESMNGSFDGAAELAARIAQSDTALTCLAQKWLTFGLGRVLTDGDQPAIEDAVQKARADGGSMQELLVALATSDVFLTRAPHDLDGDLP